MIRMLLILSLFAAAMKAQDIDALLSSLKSQNLQRSAQNAEREARFLEEKKMREDALKQAKKERDALNRETASLQAGFDANEAAIAKLEKNLKARMGNLGEIFGVVRQSAGEMKGIVDTSLVSAQFPGRDRFLAEMAASKRLPSADDLQKLWLVMLEEIIESGKVSTFRADAVRVDGSDAVVNATRIGLFSVMADGLYFRYDLDEKRLIELPKQPEARYLELARGIEAASDGDIIQAAVDPTKGALFELLMEKPTLLERIDQGGVIGYAIIVIAVSGLLIGLFRLALLLRERAGINKQLKAMEQPQTSNALGRVLGVYGANMNEAIDALETRLDEAILKEMPRLSAGASLIKIMAAVAPLLGLLGTVVGMIDTFQAITLFGTGDPKLMAGGISQALVTTMLGLLAAVPLLFMHALMRSQSRAMIEILSQQSAGLIARRMEGQEHGSAG